MNMYMQKWKDGPTSYFPTQGTRVGDGGGFRTNSCGNYHNATTDTDNRVNILHIHKDAGLFHIFEYQFYFYYVSRWQDRSDACETRNKLVCFSILFSVSFYFLSLS